LDKKHGKCSVLTYNFSPKTSFVHYSQDGDTAADIGTRYELDGPGIES
jgi:hypothetical protein